GILISLIQEDWKMAAFQGLAFLLTLPKNLSYRTWGFAVLLLAPALAAPVFHQKTKNYPLLIQTFEKESEAAGAQQLILTHSFIDFSKAILFPENQALQTQICSIDKLDSIKSLDP